MLEQHVHVQSFSKLVVLQIYCLYTRVDCEGGLYVQVSRVQATRAVSLPDVLEEGGGGSGLFLSRGLCWEAVASCCSGGPSS